MYDYKFKNFKKINQFIVLRKYLLHIINTIYIFL